MTLSDVAIYTLRHSQALATDHAHGRRGQLTERRAWTTADRLLTEARARGERIPVIFGAAEGLIDEPPVIFWAVIDDIDIDRSHPETPVTICRYSGLTAVAPPGRLSALRLRSGRVMSDGDVRPYRIVRTPGFVGA